MYLEHDLRVRFFDGTECPFLIEQCALIIAPPCCTFFLESALQSDERFGDFRELKSYTHYFRNIEEIISGILGISGANYIFRNFWENASNVI